MATSSLNVATIELIFFATFFVVVVFNNVPPPPPPLKDGGPKGPSIPHNFVPILPMQVTFVSKDRFSLHMHQKEMG